MDGSADTARHVAFGLALPMVSRQLAPRHFLAELTDEVRHAEDHGFDVCLVAEHHGGPSNALSDPMATVAWLLARTTRIHVGTGVLVLPLHSLPRLAEQAAVLQHASGGRLLIGVGAGYQPEDFALFGADLAQRGRVMSDGITALTDAWRSGEMAGQPIRPRLDDVPAPPVFVGAWSSAGIRRAALQADGWLADPIRVTADTERQATLYRVETQRVGRPPRVMVMREAWVADTDAAAAEAFGPVIEPIFRYYLRHGAFEPGHGLSATDIRIDAALRDRVICGAPDTVAQRVVDLVRRTGAETVVFGLRHPSGPAHRDVLSTIGRLGDEVLPQVRARLADDVGTRSGAAS